MASSSSLHLHLPQHFRKACLDHSCFYISGRRNDEMDSYVADITLDPPTQSQVLYVDVREGTLEWWQLTRGKRGHCIIRYKK
jgi:hypothetical protein